jgi:mediator of RNA polymerase II transcription subunit 4
LDLLFSHTHTHLQVIDQLIERDRDIQQLVEKALEMRSRQVELERVEVQMEKRNQDIGELQARLQDAEKLLELAVYHGKQKLQSISQSDNGAVTPEELIRYAHRISQASSTVSPTGWQPTDPRRPYPQDIEMRSGYLGGFTPPDPDSEVAKFASDLLAPSSEPPPKKIALGSTNGGGITLQGVSQSASKPPDSNSRPGFRMAFDEPEAMSEDSSSSSDEGT